MDLKGKSDQELIDIARQLSEKVTDKKEVILQQLDEFDVMYKELQDITEHIKNKHNG